ncbi:MAG TPA: hypothetical protein VFB12_16065 [Ktedonobacteraceae bacterium]|nr:hypothetical protein [Ktedonobacteraceae bacterium]
MLWRHGDVLIATVEQIPAGAERQHTTVLALGEVTGHSHRVEDAQKASVWKYGADLFLEVESETRIVHEEHKPIILPPGSYRVWQQREYTPERIIRVRD